MKTARIERLRAESDQLGAASFLVSDPVNVLYLTGFESSNAFVLVKHKQVVLLTDGRYIEAARAVEGVEAVQLERELAADLGPLPHHHPGERTIERDELVFVDTGAKVDGYCSDCTRTFATGDLSEELRRAYAVCRAAQEAALADVRAGADARGLDALARQEIEESGVAEVLHGLGHGVGLEVHELPVLRHSADGRLEPGNVVTVEPGVYLAGVGGVRIEDLVVVREDGAEVLTPFTKELLTLD